MAASCRRGKPPAKNANPSKQHAPGAEHAGIGRLASRRSKSSRQTGSLAWQSLEDQIALQAAPIARPVVIKTECEQHSVSTSSAAYKNGSTPAPRSASPAYPCQKRRTLDATSKSCQPKPYPCKTVDHRQDDMVCSTKDKTPPRTTWVEAG